MKLLRSMAIGLAALLAAAVPSGAVRAAGDREDQSVDLDARWTEGKGAAQAPETSDRGYLGVSIQKLRHNLRRAFEVPESVTGLLVSHVTEGSPADKAGLKDRDIITRFDGREVRDEESFTRDVRGTRPGTEVTITVWRDGRSLDLKARLDPMRKTVTKEFILNLDDRDLPDVPGPPEPPDPGDLPVGDLFIHLSRGGLLGVQLQEMNDEIAPFFSAPDGRGALVWKVIEQSPAEKAGLKAGDLIVEVEGKSIQDPADLREVLSDHDPDDTVAVTFLRRGQPQTVKVTLEQDDGDFSLFPGAMRGWRLHGPGGPDGPGRWEWREGSRGMRGRLRDDPGDLRVLELRRHADALARRGQRDVKGAMSRLQEELDRLQQRMNRLKDDLEKLKD